MLKTVARSEGYICYRCATRLALSKTSNCTRPASRRWISTGYLKKQAEAEKVWQKQAEVIKAGKQESFFSMLEKRGLVNSIAGDRHALEQLMTSKRIGAYVGIDPTASSMHIGHMLPLMTLFWLYIHGYHSVSLVRIPPNGLGGATATVGDPSGRTTSREVQGSSVRKANMVSMHYQLKRLWANVEQLSRKYGYQWEWAWHRELVNNNAWINKLPILKVLQLLGPGVKLGTMLGRDTVRNKMDKGDGMSFAEFTYPLLQSWDWWHMYQTKGIQVQIGGSDQFGNIVAGIDAIKHIAKNHPDPDIRQDQEDRSLTPYGITVPLLTTASGEKFGKSAGNAIWLDKEMTSSFDLYQFFLRSADADVERYLKLFTFIPIPRIEGIIAEHMQHPHERKAQHILARDFVELVHGEEEAKDAKARHQLLFPSRSAPVRAEAPKGDWSNPLNPHAPQTTQNNAPSANVTLPASLVYDQPIARVLYHAGLVSSKGEGHRLAQNQGAYVGSRPAGGGGMPDELKFSPVKLWDPKLTQDYIVDGDLLILRVGKWKVKIVKILSDEEFVKLGLDAPGWKEVQRLLRKRPEKVSEQTSA
ncbi:MAG: tyrosyl-tRNA synthetase [Candelina submexicana]|nr:MAG: tyrosyl-tRNA synthetase [Candelina submexicana]